jgi:hypothetical protein
VRDEAGTKSEAWESILYQLIRINLSELRNNRDDRPDEDICCASRLKLSLKKEGQSSSHHQLRRRVAQKSLNSPTTFAAHALGFFKIAISAHYLQPMRSLFVGKRKLSGHFYLMATLLMQRRTSFWFDDGSLIVHFPTTSFKVHESLLLRHAPHLKTRINVPSVPTLAQNVEESLPVLQIQELVTSDDFQILLEYLYHDLRVPLGIVHPSILLSLLIFSHTNSSAPIAHLEILLKVSAPDKLDIPSIYADVVTQLNKRFPTSLNTDSDEDAATDLEPALEIAMTYSISPEVGSKFSYSCGHVIELGPIDKENIAIPRCDFDGVRSNRYSRSFQPNQSFVSAGRC